MPVGRLSGGEQARIHIARLMREPADLLILDEPTNDLDIPTLDVLEESLAAFEGGLVLVTHDRFMLDRDRDRHRGAGRSRAAWRRSRTTRSGRRRGGSGAEAGPLTSTPLAHPALSPEGRGREEGKGRGSGIWSSGSGTGWRRPSVEAETALEACRRAAEDPAIASDPAALQAGYAAVDAARAEVDRLYARWAELEAKGETR